MLTTLCWPSARATEFASCSRRAPGMVDPPCFRLAQPTAASRWPSSSSVPASWVQLSEPWRPACEGRADYRVRPPRADLGRQPSDVCHVEVTQNLPQRRHRPGIRHHAQGVHLRHVWRRVHLPPSLQPVGRLRPALLLEVRRGDAGSERYWWCGTCRQAKPPADVNGAYVVCALCQAAG